jgi:hypothetical protein
VNGGVVSDNEATGASEACAPNCSWGGGILVGFNSHVWIDGTEIAGNEARSGAGISQPIVQRDLHVRNARIASNRGDTATYHLDGIAEFTDCVIENNQATGVFADSESYVTVLRSAIRGNVGANGGGARGHSGGYGRLEIFESSLSDNESLGNGGGILTSNWPNLSIRNSTISRNRAAGFGGGIAASVTDAELTLVHATITQNSAPQAGGLWLERLPGGFLATFSSANSIVAQNPGGDCVASGAATQPVSGGYNLIGDASDCNWTPAVGDQLGTAAAPIDAMLGPLSWWSGPTLMHAPLPGSPAIDAGNPAAPSPTGFACRPTDQRGVTRADG